MPRWGDDNTIKFIRLYRDCKCLWDSSSSSYKNNAVRKDAYMKLQRAMEKYNIDMTVKEIKQKIKVLRCTYSIELNKVKNSKTPGDCSNVYKPKLKWFNEMEFLNNTLEYRKSNITKILPPCTQTSNGTFEKSQESLETTIEVLEQPQESFETTTEIPEQRRESFQTTVEIQEEPQSHSIPLNLKKRLQTFSKRTSHNRNRHAKPNNEAITALQYLQNITSAINPRINEDEFYYFGQSVAAQLRSLPLNYALILQTKIQMLISTERSKLYIQPSSTSFTKTSIQSEDSSINTHSPIDYQMLSSPYQDIPSDSNNTDPFQALPKTEHITDNITFNTAWEDS